MENTHKNADPKCHSEYLASSKMVILFDAATLAIPPAGGQGAAMALEDAVSLAGAFSHGVFTLQPLSV